MLSGAFYFLNVIHAILGHINSPQPIIHLTARIKAKAMIRF